MMDKLYFLPSLTLIDLLLLCFFVSFVFFFPLIRFCYSHVLVLIFLILISFASLHYHLKKQERFPRIRITSTVFISFILVSCCFHHHTLIVLLSCRSILLLLRLLRSFSLFFPSTVFLLLLSCMLPTQFFEVHCLNLTLFVRTSLQRTHILFFLSSYNLCFLCFFFSGVI
jgi:hypothetical protein